MIMTCPVFAFPHLIDIQAIQLVPYKKYFITI